MSKKRRYGYPAVPLELVQKRLVRYALSPREEGVVLLLIRGFSNKEIASRCALSVETIKEYLKHLYQDWNSWTHGPARTPIRNG